MYDIKVAISGGFQIIRCHSDHLRVYNTTADVGESASAIASRDGFEPVCVHDVLTENNGLPRGEPHNGKINIVVARITNEFGMPAAVVCDSEMYVVNQAGKTVSTHRAY